MPRQPDAPPSRPPVGVEYREGMPPQWHMRKEREGNRSGFTVTVRAPAKGTMQARDGEARASMLRSEEE